jgi:CrcB protein
MAVTNSTLTLCSTRSEALTTFSSFTAEVEAMLQQYSFALAAGAASLHLFGSLALTVLGLPTVGLRWAR